MKSSDPAKKNIQKDLLALFRADIGAGMAMQQQPLVVSMTFGHPLGTPPASRTLWSFL
jgi:hypothetical protein